MREVCLLWNRNRKSD